MLLQYAASVDSLINILEAEPIVVSTLEIHFWFFTPQEGIEKSPVYRG